VNNRQKRPVSNIVPVAGDRAGTDLANNVQTHYLEFSAECDVAIAGAAAASLRNRGNIFAIFDEVALVEAGKDVQLIKGTVLRALAEQSAPSSLSGVDLSSTAIGNTHLKRTFRLYSAHPYAVMPRETAFVEHDIRAKLRAEVKLAADGGAGRLALAGVGGTVVISNLVVRVKQGCDPVEQVKPYFIPHIHSQVESVAAVNDQLDSFIKSAAVIRAIIVSQEDTAVGEVSDVINGLILQGDQRALIGPKSAAWADLVAGQEFDFGGASGFLDGQAHLVINFQEGGRLVNCLNPNQDTNLKFTFDCQPSAVGTGDSKIRLTVIELWADAQLTKPVDFPV